jgi:hypothetical protein
MSINFALHNAAFEAYDDATAQIADAWDRVLCLAQIIGEPELFGCWCCHDFGVDA